jgi:hypothetical protein
MAPGRSYLTSGEVRAQSDAASSSGTGQHNMALGLLGHRVAAYCVCSGRTRHRAGAKLAKGSRRLTSRPSCKAPLADVASSSAF